MIEILPAGKYKACYSPYVYDLFDHFSTRFSGQTPTAAIINSELDSLGFRLYENGGLTDAASSGCEVMLAADAFDYVILNGNL